VAISVGTVRLNIGCGDLPMRMPGWVNVDETAYAGVNLVLRVPPLPWATESVSEIYAGHFLEHLSRGEAAEFLGECYRVLEPAGRLGILVPDIAECFRRYVSDEPAPAEWPAGHHRDLRDLDELNEMIIFSTAQASRHQWGYDRSTLARALQRAGFEVLGEFDRFRDPRVAVGAWYQVGLDSIKP
jgi:predicted SAM-dependent methyltransferase